MKDLSQEELDLEEKALENKAVSRRSQESTDIGQGTVSNGLPKSRVEQLDKVEKYFGPRLTEAADKYGLDRNALTTVLLAEAAPHPVTGADSTAKTRIRKKDGTLASTAEGLFQFIDGTAKDMGITDKKNASQSIDAGARYLRQNLDRFGTYDKAMVAHHEGGDGLQGAIDAADSDTTGQSHWSDYIKPAARVELGTFTDLYRGLGGNDTDLTAYQSRPTSNGTGNNRLDYQLGLNFNQDRYPVKYNDPRLSNVENSKLPEAIRKNTEANAIYGNAEAQQSNVDAVKKAAMAKDQFPLTTGMGLRAAEVFSHYPKADKLRAKLSGLAGGDTTLSTPENVEEANKYASPAQKFGKEIPGIAASAAGGEYITGKLALSTLGGLAGSQAAKAVAKVLSKVPGTMAEKVPVAAAKFLGERAGTGLGYGAASAAVDDAGRAATDTKITIADNAFQLALGPAAEMGVGSIAQGLKSLAPMSLRKALGVIDSKIDGPGGMDPKQVLDDNLVSIRKPWTPWKSSSSATNKSLNADLDLLSKKVQDKALAASEKLEPIPQSPPLQLPDGRGDYYRDVPPLRINAPTVPAEINYTPRPRPQAPSPRPPDVIPITATPAQKAADQASIMAKNNADREASMAIAKKAAAERLASQQSYSKKVLQDKADALLARPRTDLGNARSIPEKGLKPSDIPKTSSLSSKREAAAEAERYRHEGPIQAADDALVKDAIDAETRNALIDKLKGQRGAADVGALSELAGKAFPTIPKAVSKAVDKITGRNSDKFVPTPLLIPGPGERVALNQNVNVKKVLDDTKDILDKAHKSRSGGNLDPDQRIRAGEVLQKEVEDATRAEYNPKTGKSTPISASGWLSRIDDKLAKHYKTMAKPGDVLDTPQEKVYLELQKRLREELGNTNTELRNLVSEQAKRIPLRNAVSNEVDKKFLSKAGSFAMRSTLPGLIGTGVGYELGGREGAVAGGVAGLAGTHAFTSVGGAKTLATLGKWGTKDSRLRMLAEQEIMRRNKTGAKK